MALATIKPTKKKRKLSRLRKPSEMSLPDWQRGLRRQFAGEQSFKLRNCGPNRVFSEFEVTNPQTKRTYRVVIRGQEPGVNYCACPDYEINTLGTCKHIEYTLRHLRKRHAATLQRGFHPTFSEVYLRYGAQREVTFSPGSECPDDLKKLAEQYFHRDGRIKQTAFAKFDTFTRAVARSDHDLRIYDDVMSLIADVRDELKRRARLKRRFAANSGAAAFRKLLKVPLYPYQRDGALFAAMAGRAIIADEMGLGKTIQAIAAAEILAQDSGVERVLIICPASLKYQWPQEIEKFSKRSTLVIEGLSHNRRKLYAEEAFFKVVNYDVIHRDLDAIAALRPDMVILDEAQRIKNWQTRAAKTIKQIESTFALILTGTPLENRIEELHSITEFVDRHRLGPLFAFKAAHEIHEEDSARVIGYQNLSKITKTLSPILIRRTKKQVLDQLPPRLDKNFFVPMTEQQWEPHNENREIVARIVQKWRRYGFLSDKDQLRLRIALQYMRMSCDSTFLIDKKTKHGTKVDELSQLLEEIFEDRQAKVVIFSQWVRMNELVAEMLDDRRWGHVHLHGGVPSKNRRELIRALREEPDCRVFLSTDAGGVGLNLQRASCVINMDLPWNPAVLEQRIGRVHRIGQRRPVRVVNFVSENTIEHGMLSLLSFKKSVFQGVLDGTEDRVFMGESAMSRFMKTVEKATESAPSVQPTPAEELSAPSPSQSEPVRDRPAASEAQGVADFFSQAGQLLQSLGQAMAGSAERSNGNGAPPSPVRIETDRDTGRPELRIALPDPEILPKWIEHLANLARSLGTGGH